MADCTIALNTGPVNVAPGVKMATYKFVGGATAWLAAGFVADMSADFTEIYAIFPAGVDTVADNAYKWGAIFPLATTISTTNVSITAHYSTGAGGAMTVVPNAADLSAVASVQFVVFGK